MSDFTEDVDWYDGDDNCCIYSVDREVINNSYNYWKPKGSDAVKIEDMKTSHLLNTIKYLEDVCMGVRPEYLSTEDRLVYLMNMKMELMKRQLGGWIEK